MGHKIVDHLLDKRYTEWTKTRRFGLSFGE